MRARTLNLSTYFRIRTSSQTVMHLNFLNCLPIVLFYSKQAWLGNIYWTMGTMRRVLPGPLKKKTLKNFNGQKKDNKERVEVVGSNTHAAITITFSSFWKKKKRKKLKRKRVFGKHQLYVSAYILTYAKGSNSKKSLTVFSVTFLFKSTTFLGMLGFKNIFQTLGNNWRRTPSCKLVTTTLIWYATDCLVCYATVYK